MRHPQTRQLHLYGMRLTFTLLSLLLFLTLATAQKKSAGGTSSYSKAKSNSTAGKQKASTLTSETTAAVSSADAPNVTGIWKGHFAQDNFGFGEDRYRFEVQIAHQANNGLESVTYSYKTTVFYGKAEATGIYTKKTNNIVLKENKLVDLKITEANTGACLMTCYLEYNKVGSVETLTGTYTSVSMKDKTTDCGSGKVYLEKVETSDFYKEDFVTKRENELKRKNKSVARRASAPKAPVASAKPVVKKPTNRSASKPVAKATTKPKTNTASGQMDAKPSLQEPPIVVNPNKEETPATPLPPVIKTLPKPDVIKNRQNDLVRTISTSEKEFKIQLYDNGEIDGDRISVYHNNELIVSNQLLTDKPITFNIHCDETNPVHEFVMVAENLGTIPPNTALMIITAGSKRYELTISSTEQKNAVVKVQYDGN